MSRRQVYVDRGQSEGDRYQGDRHQDDRIQSGCDFLPEGISFLFYHSTVFRVGITGGKVYTGQERRGWAAREEAG